MERQHDPNASDWLCKLASDHFVVPNDGASDGSIGDATTNQPIDERDEVKKQLASESRSVKIWKVVVFVTIAVAAIVFTTITYLLLRHEAIEEFGAAYVLVIASSANDNLQRAVDSTSALAQVLTSEARESGSVWPFVTLSSYEAYVGQSSAQTSAELVVVCPLVYANDFTAWSSYSLDNQAWIDRSFDVKGEERPDLNPIPSSVYRFGRFRGRTVLEPEVDKNFTAPFWQMSPPPFDTSVVNLNALSLSGYNESFDCLLRNRRHVLAMAGENSLIHYAISEEMHDRKHGKTETQTPGFANMHPHTGLMYPVFESLRNESAAIVAVIVSVLPWDTYLKNLLPTGVKGIVCVLEDSCGGKYTYEINGPAASFLGVGDMHDAAYDKFAQRVDFDAISNDTEGPASGDCHYWLTVYPCKELERQFQSSTPVKYAGIVCLVFATMTIAFLVYNCMVVRKNKKLITAAALANSIVSEIYPARVKDRMIEQQRCRAERGECGSRDGTVDDPPIRDVFPETTVFFADIVGFTAWSSGRCPTDVFLLLESFFGAFDECANRRGIFKLETVGDCYVAVAGVPEPKKNHAVAMCRFARDCLLQVAIVTEKLRHELGGDTKNLALRVGLHSGPVTGGVINCARSRFQLYGDTMNYASRMESTSLSGKIQLSPETAAIVKAAGKGKWLTPREDIVFAKGKGELRTFWLDLSSEKSVGTVDSKLTSSSEEGDNMEMSSVATEEFTRCDI